jgi:hypothetical protein
MMLLRTFLAAWYGHEGRRGAGWASNCEAHRDMGIRFIDDIWESTLGIGGRRGRQQQQLAGRVFSRVMIATAKEFPPSSGLCYRVVAASTSRSDDSIQEPTTHTMGGGGKIP